MTIHQCILTQNDCYKAGRVIKPQGVMVHSTGANNPNIGRYVGPDDGLLNSSPNHWNQSGTTACVHGFIGRLKDGSIAVYQTLPWTMRGWHAGRGAKGSANDTHISFEICEDGLTDSAYFQAVYQHAVEFTAHLCTQFQLDPMADGVVICHAEGHQRDIASNHGDVLHWFPKFNRTMDDFRRDVGNQMAQHKEEEDSMTQEQFNTMMSQYLQQLALQPPSDWSQPARKWAESTGIITGDSQGHKQYKRFCTREELIQILYSLDQK